MLSQLYAVHKISSYYSKIHFNIVPHLRLDLPSNLFPSGFPNSCTRATCFRRLNLLEFIIMTVSRVQIVKLLTATFCSLLQFLHLREHPVLKHTQSLLFPPICQALHPGEIIILYLPSSLCFYIYTYKEYKRF
jgi:hypothetical protein